MISKLIKTALLTGFLIIGSVAHADHELIVVPDTPLAESAIQYRGPYLTPYLAIGVGSGGDVIGRFTDGYGDVEKVRSGGGFLFEGGLLMAVDPVTHLRLTGGYEIDNVSRLNGHSTFDRLRFDLMLLRKFGASDLGVGLTAHTGVGYRCDINSICAGDVEFDSAVGYTVEYALTTAGVDFGGAYDRRLNPMRGARLGVRFTDIEYRSQLNLLSSSDDGLVDGKSLSAFVGFAW